MAWLILALLGGPAWAQKAPDREIPVSVLIEVDELENRFEIALASDCNPKRCFPKGCAYVDHSVADRPRSTSLPGLIAPETGPGSVKTQEFLTSARCAFAFEDSVAEEDVANLSRRLESKLSNGWLRVSVGEQRLEPIPDYLQNPPGPDDIAEPEEETPEVEEEPETPAWSFGMALYELWTHLLPHFWWMFGVGLVTVASTILIWAWRKVGARSIEDEMLLAEIARGGDVAAAVGGGEAEDLDEDEIFVREQDAVWKERLESMDESDPEIGALIRELLVSGDLPLLAKATLRFPNSFPAAFPAGGEVAEAKLELSRFLKSVEPDDLPDDAEFFRQLNRHALSAALAAQSDASIVRSLREEFGASGLVSLIESLPARAGALLFALAPAAEQHEMVRLFTPNQLVHMADQLLRSNRMDPAETAYLFQVIEAARGDGAPPEGPAQSEVSDRGTEYDAVGALAVLLPHVQPAQRSALFGNLLQRFGGSLPAWYRGIFVGDMLSALSDEARVDLLLEVEVEPLAAWLSLQDPGVKNRLLQQMPGALHASVVASSTFPSRAEQLTLAERGRKDLARGFQNQLARAGLSFEDVLRPNPGPAA